MKNQKPRLLLLLLLCAVAALFCPACGDPTSATPLPTASGSKFTTASDQSVKHSSEGPTETASPTATGTATATPTSTASPSATATPSPTSRLMPVYPPGGAYSPDTFKLIGSAPCFLKDIGGSINVSFIVGASTANVTVVYSDVQGSVVDREPMGTFDHGWHSANVTWWVIDRPSFAWLEAQIEGSFYVSDWCAIGD